ncbi:MAG: hypothetical protein JWM36_417 [Hyphomicrobiales bacterium]|nr:hypothetical protein [Hyphomicrobiales bacterium]
MDFRPPPHAWIAQAIEAGNLRITIIRAGAAETERRLLTSADLLLPIAIDEMGETIVTDISLELLEFLASGESEATYGCQACKTIVKFGTPLQFRQAFDLRFRFD